MPPVAILNKPTVYAALYHYCHIIIGIYELMKRRINMTEKRFQKAYQPILEQAAELSRKATEDFGRRITFAEALEIIKIQRLEELNDALYKYM